MQRNSLLRTKAKTMADVLKFDAAPLKQARVRKVEADHQDEYSFWPEVSQGLWVASNARPIDPENSEKRVLFEIMLILGATAAFAAIVSLFVGAPPPV